MYQIMCENPNGNKYVLHDERYESLEVLNPDCSLKLNSTGSLSFDIAPTHPYYNAIKKLCSEILLFQDDEWIFTGRVLNDDVDFDNVKHVECEGELAYLLDSNQRQAEFHDMSVKDYFATLINKHNSMVEPHKQFKVGVVTVKDNNDSLYRFSNFENTWDTIQDKLINRLGGYIRTRRAGNEKIIDYVESYENVNNQAIRFGKNLLDLNQNILGENIKTAIIPLGAKIEEENQDEAQNDDVNLEKRVTIESVNNGLYYVYDETSVNQFGWIWDTVTFDDVSVPAILKQRGEEELSKVKQINFILKLNAVDLHLLDVNIERIKLGDLIRVISEPHKIDTFLTVSEIHLDLSNPQNNSIVLGQTSTSLTDISNKNNVKADVEIIKADYLKNKDLSVVKNNILELSSSISQTAEKIVLEVYKNCATKDDIQSVNELLKSSIEVLNNAVEFKFQTATSKTTSLEEVVTSNKTLLEEYIRFQGALIELGRVGNDFTAQLSNTQLAFLQNNVKIAYISNNKLYVIDAEIKHKLTLGDGANGYFDFIPRANGNLSMKWRAN